jgi:putative component of membrane protein insertase Oxa1/YidC/SpoIIIJ protein YidD
VTALVLRVLAWIILAYRRWLSGRGPLRGVRCSFPEESCSTFGLRATSEAPTARAAIGRIARRLRRCRDACLLGDGKTLSWTPLHDRSPQAIATEMRDDGERDAAIERMLATRHTVARWRGEDTTLRPRLRPFAYSYPATMRRALRRIAVIGGFAAFAAMVIALRPWLGAIALAIATAALVLSVRSCLANHTRFAAHRDHPRLVR